MLRRKFDIFHVRRGSRPQWCLLMARRGSPHAIFPALNACRLGHLCQALSVRDKRLSLAAANNEALNAHKACKRQKGGASWREKGGQEGKVRGGAVLFKK